jgi:hypothetical protein
MGKFTKNGIALLAGAVALAAFAGLAQAETRFAVQDTNAVDQMAITDTGWIGIGLGTNNPPQSGIHLKGSVYPANAMRAEGNEVTTGGGFLGYNTHTDGTLPKASERLGFFFFGTTQAGAAMHGAGISANAAADWSPTSNPTYFSFQTTDVGQSGPANRVERLRIGSNGLIGVGTTTPRALLDVAGPIRVSTTGARPACTNATRGTFWFTQSTTVADDSLAVCSQISSVFTWKVVY